jgi:hypothetical protein
MQSGRTAIWVMQELSLYVGWVSRHFSHPPRQGRCTAYPSSDYEALNTRGLKPQQIENVLACLPPEVIQREDFHNVDGIKVIC